MPEGTKVYIATRLERANDHRMLAHALRAGGAVITYDWTLHGSVQEEGAARITQVAVAEADGVADADAVVVLLPGNRFSDYYGRHWVALFFDHGPGPAASLVYAIKEAEGRGVVAGADHLRSRWADLMIFGRDPR